MIASTVDLLFLRVSMSDAGPKKGCPPICHPSLCNYPNNFSKGLRTFKSDHHITNGGGHFVFLLSCKDTFNELYIHKGYDTLLFVLVIPAPDQTP